MSEQSTYCFYCECLRAKDAGVTHLTRIEAVHKHGGEDVYVVQITIGGDMRTCQKFAEMVEKYSHEVLGNTIQAEIGTKPTGKPN